MNKCNLALLIVASIFPCTLSAEGITTVNGKGVPNGTSNDPSYLEWLKPTKETNYGVHPENPILIGGIAEGAGHTWSAQYFSSLLGPNKEPVTFERIGVCCAFKTNQKIFETVGLKKGFLDVYQVQIKNSDLKKVYVSIYEEGNIYAPSGFTTRGKKP